jgi:hypothetical protein
MKIMKAIIAVTLIIIISSLGIAVILKEKPLNDYNEKKEIRQLPRYIGVYEYTHKNTGESFLIIDKTYAIGIIKLEKKQEEKIKEIQNDN